MKRPIVLTTLALAALGGATLAHSSLAQDKPADKRPDVAGNWSGVWGLYEPPALPNDPPKKPNPYELIKMKLDCTVEEKDGKWQATFQGEAGRPYKYTITMQGRQAGPCVLFQGTADLGPKDGGVYDWIGRADDKAFVGFYTSQGHTGHFRLSRVPKTP